ncbi:Sensor protein ZraS [Anoxybacillus sp. P3H1B]|uniref:GAF domain-containing sensor histidine kinase n=1 Tax=Anoxybacillus sp. P3H1B TaxID=1769293 RepID=UPI0007989FEB|nr:GAF domain-containing sensor histidine kinase [Anoxybacillus sp. P3H1B]KXG08525.1 Sensor protein ZraS [Anoxybacillus sp. P3H1B]
MNERQQMINLLTGVQSSKKSYYTELKKMVAELKKKNMQLEIINDITKSFNIDMSMDDMLKNTFDKLREIFPIKRISLSLYENDKLTLTNVYPLHSLYFPIGFTLPKERSIYWKVIQSLQKFFYQVQEKEESYVENAVYRELGMKSVLLVPLISKGQVIGVLSIGSSEIVRYDEADLSFFQQFGDQLAVCIENARLYREVLVSKKEWEETFRAVSEMILVVDLEGRILRYNDAAKEFFQIGGSPHTRNICELLAIEQNENPIMENVATQKPVYRRFHIQQRICDFHSYPVFNENQSIYAVIIYINDITEKLQIEAQLVQSGKLAAIGEMAAGIAHELNNPLTAILGNAQLLLRSFPKEERSSTLLSDIYSCGKRCKAIIQNLLTFARQDEYRFADCSINDAVEQVLGLIRDQIQKQNIVIQVNLDHSVEWVEGNLQQIGQIVLNLLINAKDALEEREGAEKVIAIETKTIVEHGSKWVTLSVKDNGIGIDKQHLQEIFNPFFTTKRPGKGTGLGLSVSLGIAQAHGGTIEAISERGKGSEFILKLPAKR